MSWKSAQFQHVLFPESEKNLFAKTVALEEEESSNSRGRPFKNNDKKNVRHFERQHPTVVVC